MKLSIIITHFKEPFEICKPLFDSIALQQGINFADIEVIVVQDGKDGREALKPLDTAVYPFKPIVVTMKHNGVSAARNYGLQGALGEYVMFCDCDDMFLNNYGLHLLFSAMAEQPNAITSTFVEEQKLKDGSYKIIRREKDSTFVHGKAYKRSFLNENNLRFNNELTLHEDGFFNLLAVVCAEDSKKYIETPFYLWKWNDNSTVRFSPVNFVLRTYPHLMKCRIALCKELEARGFVNELIDAVVKTVLDSFYDFNKPAYMDKDNLEYRIAGEKAFKEFFSIFKREYFECATSRKAEIAYVSRTNAYVNGLIMESTTINDWLKHIQEL